MKKCTYCLTIIIAAMLLQSCGSPDHRETDGTAIDSISDSAKTSNIDTINANLGGDETTFALAAAAGGMMEVEAATAALQQSENQQIKAFATMMLKDHGKANAELTGITASKQLELPKILPEQEATHLAALKKLNDRQFDMQHITMMIADHAKTVKLFTEGVELLDPDLKAFAARTLPLINVHYKEALRIGKTLNLSNAGNGDDLQGVSPAAGRTN